MFFLLWTGLSRGGVVPPPAPDPAPTTAGGKSKRRRQNFVIEQQEPELDPVVVQVATKQGPKEIVIQAPAFDLGVFPKSKAIALFKRQQEKALVDAWTEDDDEEAILLLL